MTAGADSGTSGTAAMVGGCGVAQPTRPSRNAATIAGAVARVRNMLVMRDPNMFLYYSRTNCMSIEVLEECPDKVLIKVKFMLDSKMKSDKSKRSFNAE